jgi:hypothetical protein
VAVHLAVQALLGRECDMALAGEYDQSPRCRLIYRDGEVLSRARFAGRWTPSPRTVLTSGAAQSCLAVADAVADGDHAHAVIRQPQSTTTAPEDGYLAPSAGVTLRPPSVWDVAGTTRKPSSTLKPTERHPGDPMRSLRYAGFQRTTGVTGFARTGW